MSRVLQHENTEQGPDVAPTLVHLDNSLVEVEVFLTISRIGLLKGPPKNLKPLSLSALGCVGAGGAFAASAQQGETVETCYIKFCILTSSGRAVFVRNRCSEDSNIEAP